MNLSKEELDLVRSMRDQGVFVPIVPELIPAEDGTVIIACADGDRLPDLLEYHWEVCGGGKCHHTLALNGGPKLIPQGSPLAHFGEDRVLLEHAYGGHKLKQVNTVVLYGHLPCGMARIHKASLVQCIDLCVAAKDRVRSFFAGRGSRPEVLLFMHIDRGEGVTKSYCFQRAQWRAWKEKHQRAAY